MRRDETRENKPWELISWMASARSYYIVPLLSHAGSLFQSRFVFPYNISRFGAVAIRSAGRRDEMAERQ